MRARKPLITLALGLVTLSTTFGVAPAIAEEAPSSSVESSVGTEEPSPAPADEQDNAGPSPTETEPEAVEETTTPEPATPTPSQDSGTSDSKDPSVQSNQLGATAASGYFTHPTGGENFTAGEALTFRVSASGSWYAELYCDGYYIDDVSSSYPSTTLPTESYEFDCSAELYVFDPDYGYERYMDSVSFTVQPAQVANEIRRLTANRTTFYPRVRDRYQDSVRFALSVRGDARVTMTVRNSDGRTVRTATVQRPYSWADYYERTSATWNGKNTAGNPVPVGRYRVTFTSEGTNLDTATARMTVKVATGFRTVRRTATKDGWYGSVDRTRGSCYTSETWYPHGNALDCWGGAYAQATYNFRVPANATILSWWARGERLCCDNGRVIKSADRVRARRYRVRVRVTNWAAYTVTRAGIEYRFRKRI